MAASPAGGGTARIIPAFYRISLSTFEVSLGVEGNVGGLLVEGFGGVWQGDAIFATSLPLAELYQNARTGSCQADDRPIGEGGSIDRPIFDIGTVAATIDNIPPSLRRA